MFPDSPLEGMGQFAPMAPNQETKEPFQSDWFPKLGSNPVYKESQEPAKPDWFPNKTSIPFLTESQEPTKPDGS